MKELKFSYDAVEDILTIEGTRYSGEVFREWSMISPITADGKCLRVIDKNNGVITILVQDHKEA